MVIVQVYVRVKENYLDDFIQATINNAKNSIQEPGVVRFDFMQEVEDPASFLLTEIYRDADAPLAHKQTPHYLKWRETVAEMMEVPRNGVKYQEIYPVEIKSWRSIDGN